VSAIPEATSRTRFYGKYRGLVADNADPLGLGRVRADVPAVLGDATSGWALPCLPGAGNGSGFHVVPPVGAGVWVEFEAGDPDYPVWTGGWWGDGQVPAEETGKPAQPALKVLRSEQGLLVALDDDDQTIAVSDADGRNLLSIAVTNGQVRVQATAKVIVEAPLIELVERGSHPVVFGDVLLQYLNQIVSMFNAHLHVGQTAAGALPVTPAPPATPFPPPAPSLLSTKVKSG
jgi:Type VI secretion system/phage-baseplate injector OB domain